MKHVNLGAVGIALALTLPRSATAVDGVIEINQARALAGHVTAHDEPGFPVTIDSSMTSVAAHRRQKRPRGIATNHNEAGRRSYTAGSHEGAQRANRHDRVPAGPRRCSGVGRRGRAALPRRGAGLLRRIPRRLGLLHAVGFPHHEPAVAGARDPRSDPGQAVLRPPVAAVAAVGRAEHRQDGARRQARWVAADHSWQGLLGCPFFERQMCHVKVYRAEIGCQPQTPVNLPIFKPPGAGP